MRFSDSSNPPILHRKELFVSESHPAHQKFSRLTKAEEKAGLYKETSKIGRRQEWEELLQEKRLALKGHRLVRTPLNLQYQG
jgi:hypothetical protein